MKNTNSWRKKAPNTLTPERIALLEEHRAQRGSGIGYTRRFKSAVYIPVAYVNARIAEYEKWAKEFNLKRVALASGRREMPRTVSAQDMRETILGEINECWEHVYSVNEYSLYRNSITGETRKERHNR